MREIDGPPSARAGARRSSAAPLHAPARTARPSSRAGGDGAARARRNRVVLVAGIIVSAAIVGAWFPVSTLLRQHAQIASASAQLSRLDKENATLRHEEKELRTPSTLGRIAQQQYDLVPPGDQAYQVLPPSGSGRADGTLAEGGTKEKSKSGATSASSGSDAGSATPAGFFGRVLQTLEFWR